MLLIRSAGVASLPSITAITPNLLQISTAREPADPYSCPAELGHQLRQAPTRAGSSAALRNFKDIEQQLRSNALDAIVADFTAHALQREPPRIDNLCRGKFSLCFSEFFHKTRQNLLLSCSVKTLS